MSRCTGQAFALTVLLFLVTASATQAQQERPELFTYAELVQLYENKDLPEALRSSFSLARSAHDHNGARRVHSDRFGDAPQQESPEASTSV